MTTSLALLLALATAAPVAATAPAAEAGIVAPAQAAAPALAECTPEAIAAAEHPRLREGRCRRALRETGVARPEARACEAIAGPDGTVQCLPVRGGVLTAPPMDASGAADRGAAARARLRERADD